MYSLGTGDVGSLPFILPKFPFHNTESLNIKMADMAGSLVASMLVLKSTSTWSIIYSSIKLLWCYLIHCKYSILSDVKNFQSDKNIWIFRKSKSKNKITVSMDVLLRMEFHMSDLFQSLHEDRYWVLQWHRFRKPWTHLHFFHFFWNCFIHWGQKIT